MKRMTNEQYYELTVPYNDALRLMLAKLDVLNHSMTPFQDDRPIHNIQSRVKSKPSIEEKLGRMELAASVDNAKDYLKDIAGVRVICYFINDVRQLVDAIKRQDDLIMIKECDYITTPKPNGYRSHHLVVGVPVCSLNCTEYYPVEIQIRTLSMDFWASMEHRINYKKERSDKAEVQAELLRYATSLDQIEKSFEHYRDNL